MSGEYEPFTPWLLTALVSQGVKMDLSQGVIPEIKVALKEQIKRGTRFRLDLVGLNQEEQSVLFNFLYEDSLQGQGEEFERIAQKVTSRKSVVDCLDSMTLWLWCCRERHAFDGVPYLPKYENFDESIPQLGERMKRITQEWTD